MTDSLSDVINGILLDDNISLTLAELCQTCRSSAEYVIEMVEEGVIEPQGAAPPEWRFDVVAVKRLQIALRLQQDLRVNAAGAALALDLLEEIEALRQRLRRMEPTLEPENMP